MSVDVSRQEFLINDLSTTSVTIYPSRAHIVRDITDIKLQPGLNEVTIYGITPTADEHSVQLDGHGPATITDMSVELILNRERFADQFPDEDSDSDAEDGEESEFEREDLKALALELKELTHDAELALETQKSASEQMRVLNAYMDSINAKHNDPESATKAVASYGTDRARIHAKWKYAMTELAKLGKAIKKTEAKLRRESKAELKTKKKEREEKQKRKALKEREARRLREEKAKFWPKKVYCVKVTLEAPTDTPDSSRRPSLDVDSLNEKSEADDVKETVVRLSLSYVVREVSWIPRYNVSISSVEKSATITYSAEFSNKTSETWKDAKVTLSTSQTSYSGLDDTVPSLRPWPIFLRDRHSYDEEDDAVHGRWDTKYSPQENLDGHALNLHRPGQDKFNRYELFGPEASGNLFGRACNISDNSAEHQKPAFGPSGFGAQSSVPPASSSAGFGNSNARTGGLFGSAPAATTDNAGPQQPQTGAAPVFGTASTPQPPPSGLFGGSSNNAPQVQGGSLFGSNTNNTQPVQTGGLFSNTTSTAPPPPTGGLFGSGANNNAQQPRSSIFDPSPAPLQHEEPTWEDSGMTTAYDLPSTRTLAPSTLSRRHKLTTLTIPSINLSYIAVPKLRKGAFLRATLHNPSDSDSAITLLSGTAGLTLDGSFLGSTTLPRTSAGEDLKLDLGVDPAIHIAYPTPTLHRSTLTGSLLSRTAAETAEAYTRSICITNTRAAPVRIMVIDQVPFSEQERLRVEVVEPRGLVRGGGEVETGEGEEGWGWARAGMGEGGEVEWTVEVEGGRAGTLALGWEVRLPVGMKVAFA